MESREVIEWAARWGIRVPPPPPGWHMWGTLVFTGEALVLVAAYVGSTEVQCHFEAFEVKSQR